MDRIVIRSPPGYQLQEAASICVDGLAAHYSQLADDVHAGRNWRHAALLVSLAEGMLLDGRVSSAGTTASEASQRFRELGAINEAADALRLVIHAHRQRAQAHRLRPGSQLQAARFLDRAEAMARAELSQNRSVGHVRCEACMLLSLAEILGDRRCRDARERATALAAEAKGLFGKVADQRGESLSLYLLAQLSMASHRYKEATSFAEEAFALFAQLGDKQGQARARLAAATALFMSNRLAWSVRFAKEAESLAREAKDQRLLAASMHVAALAYLEKCGRSRDSLATALQAATDFSRICCQGGWKEVASLVAVNALLQEGSNDKALESAKEQLQDSRQAALADRMLARVLVIQALFSRKSKEDLCQAVCIAEKTLVALRHRAGINSPHAGCYHVALLCHVIATVQLARRKLDKAMAAAEEAIKLFRQLGDTASEVASLRTLCHIYLEKGDWQKHMQVANDRINICKEAGWNRDAAAALLQVQEICIANKVAVEAMIRCKEALAMFQDDDDVGRGHALARLATMHRDRREPNAGLPLARRAEAIYREAGEAKLVANAALLLSELYLLAKDHSAAAKVASEAVIFARHVNDRHSEVRAQNFLAETKANILATESQAAGADVDKVISRGLPKVLQPAKEAILLARKLNDKQLIGASLHCLAQVHMQVGYGNQALMAITEAVALSQKVGDKEGEHRALLVKSWMHHSKKEKDLAIALAQRALALAKVSGGDEREALDMLKKVGGKAPARDDKHRRQALQDQAACDQEVLNLMGKLLRDLVRPRLQASEAVVLDRPLQDLGITSMACTRLINLLSNELALPLSESLFIENPTPRMAAEHIVELVNLQSQSWPSLRRGSAF